MVDCFAQVCDERGAGHGISKSSLKTLIQDLLLVTVHLILQLKIINEYFLSIIAASECVGRGYV